MRKFLLFAVSLVLLHTVAIAQCKYSLEDLLRRAEEHSIQQEIDSLNLVAAKSDVLRARSSFFPKISASSSFLSLRRPIKLYDAYELSQDFLGNWSSFILNTEQGKALIQKLDKKGTLDLKNTWLLNISLVQPLYVGGKIVASNKMADYALEARHWQTERKKAERQHAIKEAYYQLVSLCEKEALLGEYIGMLRSVAKDIEALQKEGYATKGDLLEAKMALSKASQGLHKLQRMTPIATQHLALLANLPLTSDFVPKDNIETLLSKVEHLSSFSISTGEEDCLPSENQANEESRKRLLSLSKAIKHQQTIIEQSSMLPQLAFFANYTSLYPNFFDSMKGNVGGAWSLGVTLQVPLTDIYVGYQAKRSAKAQELIAGLEEKKTLRKLSLEAEKGQSEETLARQIFFSSLELRKDITANLNLAKLGYKEGEVSIEKLLRTEADWFQINEEFISALTDLFIKQSALALAKQ